MFHFPTGTSGTVEPLAAFAMQWERSCAHQGAAQSLPHTERDFLQLQFYILINRVIFNFIHPLLPLLGLCTGAGLGKECS